MGVQGSSDTSEHHHHTRKELNEAQQEAFLIDIWHLSQLTYAQQDEKIGV